MKRALKKRVKAVLKNTPSSDSTPSEQLNVVNSKTHRRVSTQAAMLGLAISMGATSLLVTRQSDQAQAAAPVGSQKAASTIYAASDTEMKFVPIKLETKLVSAATMPENPVIVEPTAISQLPGLEAKLQVAANGMSVPVPTPENISSTAIDQNSLNQQPQLAQDKQAIQQIPNVVGVNGIKTAFGTDKVPTAVKPNTVASEEVNAQLKAQQEFALYHLQEKSNRLRASLSQLRSEESQNSAKTIASAQQTTVEENLPQTANQAATPQLPELVDDDKTKFFPEVKQTKSPSEQAQPVATTSTLGTPEIAPPSDTNTAYEVKPGDTLAAIASRYNTTVAELAKLNNISNPNELKISQKLILRAAKVNHNVGIPIPVVVNPSGVQSRNNLRVATVPINTASIDPNLSLAPVSPVFANNTNRAVATTATAPNQQKRNPVTTFANTDSQGIGGDIPVPKVFAELQPAKQPAQNAPIGRDNERLRGLQAEIQKLQQKYRAQESGNVVAATSDLENTQSAIPIPVASPSNLSVTKPVSGTKDFAVPIPVPTPILPSYAAQPVKPEFRAARTNEPINPEFLPNQAVSPSRNRATLPIGVNASDSLGRTRGTKISPQLPPLAAVDRYLPKPVDETLPPPSNSSVAYIWPAKGVFTSGYGPRWGRMHRGIDVANAVGTPISASADGVVEKAGWNKGGYGLLVDIRHPDGSLTRYAHNSKIMVRLGQQVSQGDTIAAMGSTGFSTGPHTHFEIHQSGKGAVNPIAFLPQKQNRI